MSFTIILRAYNKEWLFPSLRGAGLSMHFFWKEKIYLLKVLCKLRKLKEKKQTVGPVYLA